MNTLFSQYKHSTQQNIMKTGNSRSKEQSLIPE